MPAAATPAVGGIAMMFGRWYPLAGAGTGVPEEPGLFQLRVPKGLISFPRGKSAMIHYGASDNIQNSIADLAAQWGDRDWLCRHTVELLNSERADLDAALASLLSRFEHRFGARPSMPE